MKKKQLLLLTLALMPSGHMFAGGYGFYLPSAAQAAQAAQAAAPAAQTWGQYAADLGSQGLGYVQPYAAQAWEYAQPYAAQAWQSASALGSRGLGYVQPYAAQAWQYAQPYAAQAGQLVSQITPAQQAALAALGLGAAYRYGPMILARMQLPYIMQEYNAIDKSSWSDLFKSEIAMHFSSLQRDLSKGYLSTQELKILIKNFKGIELSRSGTSKSALEQLKNSVLVMLNRIYNMRLGHRFGTMVIPRPATF